MKDQVIRGTLLAEALLTSGLVVGKPAHGDDSQIAAEKRGLLVLGAGVAGLALALAAAERGGEVTVVEKDGVPFGALSTGYWRLVDPTEYDWPHRHWREGQLPMPTPGYAVPDVLLPLPLIRAAGWMLASVWSTLHGSVLFPQTPGASVRVGAGSVSILYGRDANALSIDDSASASALATRTPGQPMLSVSAAAATASVRVSSSGWDTPQWVRTPFAAVVSCIGIGVEVTSERPVPAAADAGKWNGFRGFRFWGDYDGMRQKGFAANVDGLKPRAILISGSGDGAMQDFQRATTGQFGRDLYDKITGAVGAARFRPEAAMQDALLAEDHARRAHGWRPAGSKIDEAFAYWHDQYARAVHEVWTRWTPHEQSVVAHTVLRPEVVNELRRLEQPRVTVRWVIRESSPAYAYGLNRFLCLLVLKLMAHQQGEELAKRAPIFRENTEITVIKPVAPHVCAGNPTLCYAQPHKVRLTDLSTGKFQTRLFDLILIRHGQELSSLLGGAAVPEQHVPFDLPR
ncbi:FAD-binding protein [Paraburkholderia nemoris]|uniref:FAD-dependent oxidoreductase n=1 Tax=Paraburkholderia nemoris TaxID=2793076 RepID=UPI0038BD5B48